MSNGVDEFLDAGNEQDTGADDAAAAELAAQAEVERVAEEQAAAAKVAEEQTAVAKTKAFETAMIDERRKRQELEARLAEKEASNEDRDEYAESIKAELRAETQRELVTQKLNISEAFAREKHTDFEDKLDIFKGMIQENPALYHQMVQQINPAEFMYKTASNQQKLAEISNPEEYEQKLREKLTAEIEANMKKKYDTEAAKRDNLPGTLANTRGAAGTHNLEWSGPPPLSDILG